MGFTGTRRPEKNDSSWWNDPVLKSQIGRGERKNYSFIYDLFGRLSIGYSIPNRSVYHIGTQVPEESNPFFVMQILSHRLNVLDEVDRGYLNSHVSAQLFGQIPLVPQDPWPQFSCDIRLEIVTGALENPLYTLLFTRNICLYFHIFRLPPIPGLYP